MEPVITEITEVSTEMDLHSLPGKKFTVIMSFVYGKSIVRYCAYRGPLCVCALKTMDEAWKIYKGIDDKTPIADPQLN